MFPPENITNHSYNTRSNIRRKSQNVLSELIQARDWQGASRRVRSHPYDVLIQDCNGLNPLHIAVLSFYTTTTAIALAVNTSLVRSHTTARLAYPSTPATIPISTLTTLLSSPFSPHGLMHQPPPIINTAINLAATEESSSSSEAKATPLHLACRNTTTPDSIIIAISRANSLALDLQDDDGDTPLHLALRYGASEKTLQTLIELAYNQTPHLSSVNDDIDDDEEGTAFAKADYEDGDIPLHVAISHNASIDTIQLLVDAYPQGMFAMNHAQQTPLMIACVCGRYDIVDKVVLESNVVIGSISDLLEMGGCELNDAMGRPVSCLWENFVVAKHESGGDVEALETIANLLMAATLDKESMCQTKDHDTEQSKTQDKQGSRCTTTIETTTLTYSFDQAYRLLLAAISLGECIVPPAFVSFLIEIHPSILQKIDPSSGRMPLHIAVMQSHPKNSLGDIFDSSPSTPISTPLVAVAVTGSRDGNHYPTPASKNIKTSPLSVNEEVSSSKLSHSILNVILNSYPKAACQRDHRGCLPFHIAIEAGMKWEDGMKDVFMVAPKALRTLEPNTSLYPFMLAATVKSTPSVKANDNNKYIKNGMTKSSLDGVFSLLRCAPDVIALSCGAGAQFGGGVRPSCKKKKNTRSLKSGIGRDRIVRDIATVSLTAGSMSRNFKNAAGEDYLRPSKRQKRSFT